MAKNYDLKEAADKIGAKNIDVEPILHRVVVQVPDKSEKVGSSQILYAPDSYQDKEHLGGHIGKIVSIGEIAFQDFQTNRIPQIGDLVFYKRYSGQEFWKGETMYRIMNDEDVLGVVKIDN